MSVPSPPTVKAVLIGDKSVGKTCIFRRLQDDTFSPDQLATIGGSYLRLSVADRSGSRVDVGLWDTAGAEQYRAIVPMYFQRAQIIVCVFDLTVTESLRNVGEWVAMARNKAPARAKFVLVGNKSDLDGDRQVRADAAQQLSEDIGALAYIETSARTGTGIDILRAQLGAMATTDDEEGDAVEQVLAGEAAADEGRAGGCGAAC
jgi:small GTP-binding protein